MNQALWVAKTGLDAQQTRMSVVSNNLANTNTTGFKQDGTVVITYRRTVLVYKRGHAPVLPGPTPRA